MINILNDFYNEIKDNKILYFILRKFYKNPNEFIYINENKNNKVYSILLLNNNFLKFITILFKDEEFLEKMDYESIKKLNSFLTNQHIFFYVNRHPFDKKNIIDYVNLRIKNRNIYKLENIKERIDKFDLQLSYKAIDITKKKLNKLKEIELNKQKFFKNLSEEEIDSEESILNNSKYPYKKILVSFVCNNDFLNLIEQKFLNTKLPYSTYCNILDILSTSIRIKTKNYKNSSDIALEEKISKNVIKSFDIKRANDLLYNLKRQKPYRGKIVKLYV